MYEESKTQHYASADLWFSFIYIYACRPRISSLCTSVAQAGEKTKQLEDIHEKTQFARDEAKRRRAQLLRQQRELREVGG